jgi:hypothetical protein
MAVQIGWLTMGCPTGMPYAATTFHRVLLNQKIKIGKPSLYLADQQLFLC